MRNRSDFVEQQDLGAARVVARIKPFIKWTGGKSKLISQLAPMLPAGYERLRWVQPFMGSASLYFAWHPIPAVLADLNPDLVHTFCAVRDDVGTVLRSLREMAADHRDAPESYYLATRVAYNARLGTRAQRAAMFIYLNKTGFNGLYRVNNSGAFNVPFGKHDKFAPDETTLRSASARLAGVEIRHESFEVTLADVRRGDFVYLDPPYAPVSETARFTGYTTAGFTVEHQTRLRDMCRELGARGVNFMLNNSDTPLVHELYAGFQIETVSRSGTMNSDGAKRGRVAEVVVRNYVGEPS